MTTPFAPSSPRFCPAPQCPFHQPGRSGWRYVRIGFYSRLCPPHRVQRYRCNHCARRFSDQTFSTSYWLRRPQLLAPVFHRLLGCSAFRQIAREFSASPTTVQTHAARLGRHCLLFHLRHRPTQPLEPLALDSFVSFEFSQYHPSAFHLLVGPSHFVYGFTHSELRRSGRMTGRQKLRRAALERRFGRPHPRSTERQVAALLALVAPHPQTLELVSDQHTDYPRAFRHLPHLRLRHRTVPSRAARTPRNPLFPINLLDLLIRHASANHKRETIAFSKRRQSAAERLWLLLAWRNYLKSCSEQRPGTTPAMRLGVLSRPLSVAQLLERRLFATHTPPAPPWDADYRREVPTRTIPNASRHRLRYAF